jgi:hypothetical protein
MLADPTFADIVHSIGEASLGADDETIKHLTKVRAVRAPAAAAAVGISGLVPQQAAAKHAAVRHLPA